ncbi:MAG: alpha/beta hydrolase-fold protein [bacterium]|nr:alpha/beta hydrolase-fold protein [bacterium]
MTIRPGKLAHSAWMLTVLAVFCVPAVPVRAADSCPVTPPRPALILELKDLMERYSSISSNQLFANHCRSILDALNATVSVSRADSILLQSVYDSFTDTTAQWNASRFASYTERKRPIVLSWISPVDGEVSLACLVLPDAWSPDNAYPLTVRLHGLSDEAYGTRIRFLHRYFNPRQVLDESFENGYVLLPWGRGNLWYHGVGETDIWESIRAVKSGFRIDENRQYLVGFSMGGYGSWKLGIESPDTWAAVGVFAGALWYDGGALLNRSVVYTLRDMPVYFVCGQSDGLLSVNESAYSTLLETGNPDLVFTTFPGGHEAPVEQWRAMHEWMRPLTRKGSGTDGSSRPFRPGSPVLLGNYPNPFNPETRIQYTVPGPGDVEIRIFCASGGLIRTLQQRASSAGRFEVRWDGKDRSGRPVPTGIYLCRIACGSSNGRSAASLKMCLVR